MPAVVVRDRCIGCEICVRRCPLDAMETVALPEPEVILGRKVKKTVVVKYPEECWHCGVCRLDCPTDAIRFDFFDEMLAGVSRALPEVAAEAVDGGLEAGWRWLW